MAVETKLLEKKLLTYEEYLALPEIEGRYDIIDGELLMSPAPTPFHQRILINLILLLTPVVRERQLGEVLCAPLDVVICREPLRTRQPDLIFIRAERTDIIGDQLIEGAPDLIVEILSPSNTRAEVEKKLKDYAAIGVSECWLVSPEAQIIEVLRLTKKGWKRQVIYGLGDKLTSPLLPGFSLKVDEIFA
jgi:Uma2 family endonuclease